MDIKQVIYENVKKAAKSSLNIELEGVSIERPEKELFGEYSTNVAMVLGKKVGKNPMDIAKKLCEELNGVEMSFSEETLTYPLFKKIDCVLPGFINFHLSDESLKYVLSEIQSSGDVFGSSNVGNNKNVIVEYSAPNPNKPLHIGHSRNNFLGSSLAEIFKFIGYKVLRVNYFNNWGTHICKSMLMYQKYGQNKDPDKKPDHFIGDFYIRYEQEVETNPELEKELAAMFVKLEAGDKETTVLWEKITGWAYEGWKKTYEDQNVGFDAYMYQSDYRESGKDMVKLAVDKGFAEKDETGAVIARLEKYGLPDKVLLRKDGTSIYVTQDIQLAKDSYDKYHFGMRMYVVDNRQSDYFKQLFKIVELLGFDWASNLKHVGYGVVSLPEGSMSSRKGTVTNADNVHAEVIALEREEISASLKSVTSIEDTVEKVSLAALRYAMLKVDPKQDIVFRLEQVVKFEGNTGPYLVYTYARSKSVLEKAGLLDGGMGLSSFLNVSLEDKERAVLKKLREFPEVVLEAADKMSPHLIANYLFDLASRFNSFYGEVPILDTRDKGKRDLRLEITGSTAQVLKNGLKLLGIAVVEKM